MNLGPTELIIILVIVLVLFGSTRLPKLARSMGQSSKEFKKGIDGDDDDEAASAKAKADEEPVTMTKGELDRLLAEREAAARQAAAPAPPAPAPTTPPAPPSGEAP